MCTKEDYFGPKIIKGDYYLCKAGVILCDLTHSSSFDMFFFYRDVYIRGICLVLDIYVFYYILFM